MKILSKIITIQFSLLVILLLYTIILTKPVDAATLEVPNQYSTIQAAINAAQTGDIVDVAAGTYNEVINFNGKEITVQGTDQGVSILDGTGLNDSVVTAFSGETTNTVLSGFTITNGDNFYGGGAYVESSSITFKNLIFTNNTAEWGAAISYWDSASSIIENVQINSNSGRSVLDIDWNSDVLIKNSTISNNSVFSSGGLIRTRFSGSVYDNVVIENNTSSDWSLISVQFNNASTNYGNELPVIIKNSIIRNNTASNLLQITYGQLTIEKSEISNNYSLLSLIYNGNFSFLDISSSTIANNVIASTSPIVILNSNEYYPDGGNEGDINIMDSIIWGNSGSSGVQISPPSINYAPVYINYSLIEGGWPDTSSLGILDTDPLFIDLSNGDYSLTSASLAIDAGNPNSPFDPDGTIADLGAYPFFQESSPIEQIEDLVDIVEGFNLQNGIDNSLDAKLDSAVNALDDLNQNNDQAAINSLQSFINAVEAQRGNKITDAQADQLVAAANEIINALSS